MVKFIVHFCVKNKTITQYINRDPDEVSAMEESAEATENVNIFKRIVCSFWLMQGKGHYRNYGPSPCIGLNTFLAGQSQLYN